MTGRKFESTRGVLAGFGEAVGKMVEAVAERFETLADALYGVNVRASAHVARGGAYYAERDQDSMRRTLFVHPLDKMVLDNEGDPLTHLDEALGWIYERAERELDQLLVQADTRVRLGASRQRQRMAEWQAAHGVTDRDLRAAMTLAEHRRITGCEPPFTLAELSEAIFRRDLLLFKQVNQ